MPRADNLLQLMEWNKLGRLYYIHRDFIQYLDIESIISMCSISKHYHDKYLCYCLQHYFATHVYILQSFKKYYFENYWFAKDLSIPRVLSTNSFNNMNFEYKVNKLKHMYNHNKNIRRMLDRFFGRTKCASSSSTNLKVTCEVKWN